MAEITETGGSKNMGSNIFWGIVIFLAGLSSLSIGKILSHNINPDLSNISLFGTLGISFIVFSVLWMVIGLVILIWGIFARGK